MGFHNTLNYIYFYCAGPKGETNEFLLNNKNMKGVRWNHNDKTPLRIIATDSTYFYCVYEDYGKKTSNIQANIDPLKAFIKKNFNLRSLDNNSNPLIIKIKFKL